MGISERADPSDGIFGYITVIIIILIIGRDTISEFRSTMEGRGNSNA